VNQFKDPPQLPKILERVHLILSSGLTCLPHVLTRNASTWAMTVDGVPKTPSSNTTNPGAPAARFTIGAWSDGTRGFVGEIDEVSAYTADISGTTATAHWAAGRVADTVTALTSRTAFDRLGRATDAWAPDLVRTKAVYDRLGNQTETVANYQDGTTAGGTASDDVRSTFAYDVLGELIGYCPAEEVNIGGCDPSNSGEDQAWRYAFDALGRQTKTIPPDNTAITDLTTEETVYEAGGRVAKTCRYPAGTSCGDYNSRHVDFTYDNLGRALTQKTYDRLANPASDLLKFTKTLTWNADGAPATVNEGADTLTYVYDTAGRVSQFKRSSTVLTSYTYTAGTSTIATRTDGTQGTVTFSYDWARRQTVIDPPDSYVAGTVTGSYRLDGLLSTQSFPSSITETLTYDAAKRPTSISLGSAGSLSQTYDRAGSVTSDGRSLTGIPGDAGTNTQSFSYDALHRLTGSTGLAAGSTSYQYDLDGNRTRRVEAGVTTDYLYDRADQLQQQTISGTTKTFAYDRYGNLTQSADAASAYTTFSFDEASRLTGITPPSGGAVSFTLDALDRPATRSVAGSGTSDTYGYLATSETAYLTGSGTTTGSLLEAEGTRLAVKTGSSVSWLVFDLHGSVAGLCPAGTSSLADAYRYDGWGRQVAKSGSSTNPYRYRGLLNLGADELSGSLLAMGAREYSSQLGTFTQEDSVAGTAANPATMNRFLYALANPATLIDPDGHMALNVGSLSTGCPITGCATSTTTSSSTTTSTTSIPHQTVNETSLCSGGCTTVWPGDGTSEGRAGENPGPVYDPVLCGLTSYNPYGFSVIGYGCGVTDETRDEIVQAQSQWGAAIGLLGAGIVACILGCPQLAVAIGGTTIGTAAIGAWNATKDKLQTVVARIQAFFGRVPTAPFLPNTRSLADQVAQQTGGVLKQLSNGWQVNIQNGGRDIVIRIMDSGGGRTLYYKVSNAGKEAYDAFGRVTTDPEFIHTQISATSLEEILRIVATIKGG
jgi:RHS repeat-associated protein